LTKKNTFQPDYAIPPGETLLEVIESKEITQTELACRTGKHIKTINEIIKGKAPITPDTALQLEKVLDIDAGFWNNLEKNYRETLARIEEKKNMKKDLDWLKKVPVKTLSAYGFIKHTKDEYEQLTEVYKFYGINNSSAWKKVWKKPIAAFRQSRAFESEPVAVSAWLRAGEIKASEIECVAFKKSVFKQSFMRIRDLTVNFTDETIEKMIRICSESGVALVLLPGFPKAPVSGAVRWLKPDKVLIQLSLRHKTDDHFWFTFFHEAAHIILHNKQNFIEEDIENQQEEEANNFASEYLIPSGKFHHFIDTHKTRYGKRIISKMEITQFASELNIAPGIVVGRLQREGYLNYKHCNDLKTKI
jgi:HTH-type transcriptional regulator / antitoxin HigA